MRILRRNKAFTLFNILGLSTGVAASVLIFLVIHWETSYDSYHKNKDRLFRVVTTMVSRSNGEAVSRHAYAPLGPVVIMPEGGGYNYLTLRIRPDAVKTAMPKVQAIFTRYCPDILFDCSWLDERIAHFYEREETTAQLVKVFAGLAIFISCLGLYGLVAFLAVQRMKEIGIRKVLGASVGSIVVLFSREFTVLTGLAFLISAPVGYLVMHRWLEGFFYHVGLGWGVFALTFGLSLVIAWGTVGYRALRSATVNPAKSLKAE